MSVKHSEGIRAVTVPGITAPNAQDILTAPCRLVGWSLLGANQASPEVQGAVVAPGALTTICQITGVPAGEYKMEWSVSLFGPAAVADQNNFRVRVGGVGKADSDNLPAQGVYPQGDLAIVVAPGGQTVQIISIGAGTAAVTYDAQFTLSAGPVTQAQIGDSGQPLGVSAMDAGKTDTQWLQDCGVYVSTKLTVAVLAGSVSGVLYVTDHYDDDTDPPAYQG